MTFYFNPELGDKYDSFSRFDNWGIVVCTHCGGESTLDEWGITKENDIRIGKCPICGRYSTVLHIDEEEIHVYQE